MKSNYPPVIPKSLINIAAATVFGVEVSDILGRSRKQRISDARQAALYIANQSGHSVLDLVNYYHRDQISIRLAIDTCKEKMDTEPRYFACVVAACKRLMEGTCFPPATLLHYHD